MSSSPTATDHLKWGDKRFVTKVAEGGQLEIALAQLAAERATNADVRSFAQQLLTDHQAMSRQLEQLAQSKGLQNEIAEYASKTTDAGLTAMNATSSATNQSAYNASSGSSATASSTNAAGNADRSRAGTVASSTGEYDRSSATAGASANWNDPTKNRHYKHLAGKSGADFDKEYISMMVSDHEDDVALFTKEAKKADDTDVRSFADSNLPKLQEHLSRAQQISGQLKS